MVDGQTDSPVSILLFDGSSCLSSYLGFAELGTYSVASQTLTAILVTESYADFQAKFYQGKFYSIASTHTRTHTHTRKHKHTLTIPSLTASMSYSPSTLEDYDDSKTYTSTGKSLY